MLKERLLALIEAFGDRRVLVVGDIIADEFIYGKISRVSREAPVLILKDDATEMVCKGPDYTVESVPERAVGQSSGGRTVIVGDEKRHSTRDFVARLAGR